MDWLMDGTMKASGCFCAVLVVCMLLSFFRFLND